MSTTSQMNWCAPRKSTSPPAHCLTARLVGTAGQGANFDKIRSFPSYITNTLDQYTSINGTAQGYDMEGNQLAMQLSPSHAIVQHGLGQ